MNHPVKPVGRRKTLPCKPSALLALAIDDVIKARKMEYVEIDMNRWMWRSMEDGGIKPVCTVCLTGAVMLCSLNGVRKYLDQAASVINVAPDDFDMDPDDMGPFLTKDVVLKLNWLNDFRVRSDKPALLPTIFNITPFVELRPSTVANAMLCAAELFNKCPGGLRSGYNNNLDACLRWYGKAAVIFQKHGF